LVRLNWPSHMSKKNGRQLLRKGAKKNPRNFIKDDFLNQLTLRGSFPA
jgi:hypothetical protein